MTALSESRSGPVCCFYKTFIDEAAVIRFRYLWVRQRNSSSRQQINLGRNTHIMSLTNRAADRTHWAKRKYFRIYKLAAHISLQHKTNRMEWKERIVYNECAQRMMLSWTAQSPHCLSSNGYLFFTVVVYEVSASQMLCRVVRLDCQELIFNFHQLRYPQE